jgi:hypothetical protein
VPIKIYKNNMTINANALIDSGAMAFFIDINFIEKHRLPMKLRNRPTQVEVVDGRTIESGTVTHESKPLDISLDNFICKVAFNIIKFPNNPIILGQNWLKVYNPKIDWQNKKLIFSKPTNIVEVSFKNESKSKVEKENFGKNQWKCQDKKYPIKGKKQKRGGNEAINYKKPLMVGAQAFMHAAKQGTSFAIYAIPIQKNSKPCT